MRVPADGVKTGENDDLRRIVDDEFDARGVFKGADVPALAADDARLHIVVRQRHHRNGDLRCVVGRTALDGEAYDLFGVRIRLVLRLLLDVAHLHGDVVPRLFENAVGQGLFCLFPRELGDLFKLLHHQVVLMGDLFLHFFDLALLTDEVLLLLFERIRPLLQGVLFFVEVVFLLHEALFRLLKFEPLFFRFALKFVP